MKATMSDLNRLLFEQLERLNDDELTGAALDEQVTKTKTMNGVAGLLLKSAELNLRAKEIALKEGLENDPKLLEA